MASHGVRGRSSVKPTSEQDRRKELRKIQDYKKLVDTVTIEIRQYHFSLDVLELTSKLLAQNPEYYTIWNHRRLILQHLLSQNSNDYPYDDIAESQHSRTQVELISNDLGFLVPLLRRFPKCYWIWSYRLWVLNEASRRLPVIETRRFWQQELVLVANMLVMDNRNFHGWFYRRTIVAALESKFGKPDATTKSMTEEEFAYTTRMTEMSLSNFAAWHNRSKLIPKLLNERAAGNEERKEHLNHELELIQRALYADPYDASIWSYHQYLMGNLDPQFSSTSTVPNLTTEERLIYLRNEFENLRELLEEETDCKWIYQSLIQLARTLKAVSQKWPVHEQQLRAWIGELKRVDPLRIERWNDLEQKFQISP